MKLIMTKGLPASGKSTWAKELVELNPNFVRVNKDDLRVELLKGEWTKAQEKEVILPARDARVQEALASGKSVVVDDTNFEPVHEKTLRAIAERYGATFETKLFPIDVDEAIARDAKRWNPVGEQVIRDMAKRHLHDEVPLTAPYTKVRGSSDGLPPAIICDLDGTLALFCRSRNCGCELPHRSPYDASRADLDRMNPIVADTVWVLKQAYAAEVIFMSGREEKYRQPTIQFLNGIGHYQPTLFMRDTGDFRKDTVVKAELFDAHVRDKYSVILVLDDRNSVVEMWRSIGLPVFQVADGDF